MDGSFPEAAKPAAAKLGTQRWGFLKILKTARRNALEIIPEIAVTQPMVSGKILRRFHLVMDPESLKVILKDRAEAYPKSPESLNMLRKALGNGIFLAQGDAWRWQRRAAMPVFVPRNLAALTPVMTEAAEASAKRVASDEGPIDMAAEMLRTAFDVISAVSFSGDAGISREVTHRAIDRYLASTGRVSLFDFLGMPDWVPRPERVFTDPALRDLQRAADAAIDARRGKPLGKAPALLDLLLDAADPETGRRMTTAELRDNLLTFLVAGHETTALSLSWSLYLCAFDPVVQAKARAEAQAVLGSRAATAADVPNLPYVRQVIMEAMRLYPPVAFLSRTATRPDTLCGREVRPGDTMMLPIYALHRSRLLWDDPDAFDPDRFKDPRGIDRFAYLPFGAGPRICLGSDFGMQEAVIVLSTLLARFRFTRVPGREPKPVMILSLRPEGGVWLKATRL